MAGSEYTDESDDDNDAEGRESESFVRNNLSDVVQNVAVDKFAIVATSHLWWWCQPRMRIEAGGVGEGDCGYPGGVSADRLKVLAK